MEAGLLAMQYLFRFQAGREIYCWSDATISSASQNIYEYRFSSPDGSTHEESNGDGDFGAGRALLRTLSDNEVINTVVEVLRDYE